MFVEAENFIYDLGEVAMTKIGYVDLVTYPDIEEVPTFFYMKCKNGETYKVQINITKIDD